MAIPVNPYITGNPVGGTNAFIGRDDILREVRRILDRPYDNAIVLFGQRRIGKTSILQHLEAQLADQGLYCPVYFDLQDKVDWSLARVLRDLACAIAHALGQPDPDLGDNPEFAFRDQWLPAILESLPDGCSLVLLFDEFDVLAEPEREQAAKDFFYYLRGLLSRDHSHLQFVFVIGRNVDDLDNVALSLFRGTSHQHISLLCKDNTVKLVRLSHTNDGLNWPDDAVERVWELTQGHPYLTQQLCSMILERAYDQEPEGLPDVVPKDIDAAVSDALDRSDNAMRWLWDGLPPAARVVASALAETGPELISEDALEHYLRESGVSIIIRELKDAPKLLKEWDILEPVDRGYCFRVELLRRWIAEHKPLRRVQEELDRIEPVAESLYQAALGLYKSQQLENAMLLLRQATELNPNHVRANQLLADILLAQGQPEEAQRLLERLYEYQPAAARPRLMQALLTRARSVARREEQLVLYERVLELDEKQPEAIVGRQRIRLQELDELEQARRYRDALNLVSELAKDYPKVEDWPSKIAEIKRKMQRHDLNTGLQELGRFEQEGQYQDALRLARELSDAYPNARDWSSRLAEIEQRMHHRDLVAQLQQLEKLEKEEKYQDALELVERLASAREYRGIRDWSGDLERLMRKTELATQFKLLSPWNPLDHIRLLRWLLVYPQRLKHYREVYEKSERQVGRWLTSTLIWLPLFIPTLALGLEALSQPQNTFSSIAYLGISVGLVIAWMLTGWVGDSGNFAVATVVVVLAVVVAGGASFLLVTGSMDDAMIGAAFVVAIVVAGGVAGGDAFILAGGEALVMAFVVAFVIAGGLAGSMVAGALAFILTFIVSFVIIGGLADVVHKTLETGQSSRIARLALGILLIAYVFLIGFSFLGSGQVL